MAVDGEADEGADFVESADACCAWVDVEALEGFVVQHLEDVRMAADEELGRTGIEAAADAGVVVTGIAADVLHEYFDFFATEPVFFAEHVTQVASVDVAIDGAQGCYLPEAFGEFDGADVAGMPYLVTFAEVFLVSVVPKAVGVGEESYACHDVS